MPIQQYQATSPSARMKRTIKETSGLKYRDPTNVSFLYLSKFLIYPCISRLSKICVYAMISTDGWKISEWYLVSNFDLPDFLSFSVDCE